MKKEKEIRIVISNPEAIEAAKKKFTEYVLKAYEMKKATEEKQG